MMVRPPPILLLHRGGIHPSGREQMVSVGCLSRGSEYADEIFVARAMPVPSCTRVEGCIHGASSGWRHGKEKDQCHRCRAFVHRWETAVMMKFSICCRMSVLCYIIATVPIIALVVACHCIRNESVIP